jgi:hypothetical protein
MEGMSCAIRSSNKMILRIPTVRLVSDDVDLRAITNHVSDRRNISAAIVRLNSCENPCLRNPRTKNTRPATVYVPYIKSGHRRPTICSGGSKVSNIFLRRDTANRTDYSNPISKAGRCDVDHLSDGWRNIAMSLIGGF